MNQRRRDPFFFRLTVAMTAATLGGFAYTYFGPLAGGSFEPVSPTVHFHAWTFFAWYLLLPVQAFLVQRRYMSWHRSLGTASVVLAAAMVLTGLTVVGVRIDLSLQPGGSAFWSRNGAAIFSTVLLFAIYYVLAMRQRRIPASHRRLMILASAAGLGAAMFRVIWALFGLGPLTQLWGILSTNLFVAAAVVHDLRTDGRVHPTLAYGLAFSLAVQLGFHFVPVTPLGPLVLGALAAMGRLLAPLYL